jgi:hypothetical protein
MADPDNIQRYLQNQLNPSDDVAIAPILAQVKSRAMEQYEGALRGEFKAPGAAHAAKLEQFSQEFDSTVVERMQKGVDNKDADASAYKESDGKKEGFIGKVVSMFTGMLSGGLSWIGIILEAVGINNNITKWLVDKSSNLTPEEKAKEKQAAGMVSGLEGKLNIGGINVAISADEKKEIFEQLRDADLDTPVVVPNHTAAKAAAAEVPKVTIPGTGAESASTTKPVTPTPVSTQTADPAALAANKEAVATPK